MPKKTKTSKTSHNEPPFRPVVFGRSRIKSIDPNPPQPNNTQKTTPDTHKPQVNKPYYDGPLVRIFGGPTARILDEADIVGNMEQTISMLSESTGLDNRTVKTVLTRLKKFRLIRKGRKSGKNQTYRFNVETTLRHLVNWGTQLTFRNIKLTKTHAKPRRKP